MIAPLVPALKTLPLADLLASKAVPGLMLTSGVLLAFAEGATETMPASAATIIASLAQLLVTGGGLAAAGAFILRRVDKLLDARDAARKEEAALDRAERERQYSDHKETTSRYIASLEARVQRAEERYDRLVEVLMGKPSTPNHETKPLS